MFENINLNDNERMIQNTIRQDADIPVEVHEKINKAYRMIEEHKVTQHSAPRDPFGWLKTGGKFAGGIAAVFAVGLTVCAANPAMADSIPVVGSVFELLQDKVSFFGNLSEDALTLEEPNAETADADNTDTDSAGASADTLYTQTVNGITVSFSEVYANSQTVYLGMTVHSENAFPDTLVDQSGNPSIEMLADLSPDFLSNTDSNIQFYNPEGEFTDDHTYACILRYDLSAAAKDYTEYNEKHTELEQQILDEMGVTQDQMDDETDEGYALLSEYVDKVAEQEGALQSYIKDIEIPDSFTLHVDFSQIIGSKAETGEIDTSSEDYTYPNEAENYWFDGSWTFDLPITVDNSKTETQELNDTNDDGIGLKSATKSPYEISFEELYQDGSDSDTFLVALDANGNKLPYVNSASNTNTFAIQDRDISTVDVYILDYTQYMDELKSPENYDNNETKAEGEKWSDLLDQHALYHTTLHF